MEQDNFIKELFKIIKDQADIIVKLEARISDLEEEVHQLKHPTNINTGSVPPSQDNSKILAYVKKVERNQAGS